MTAPQHLLPSEAPTLREVRIHGDVTVADLPLLMDHLDDLLLQTPDRIVVDLSTCPSLHPRAVQVLLDAHTRLGAHDGTLEIRGANHDTLVLLADEGVLPLFDVTPARALAPVIPIAQTA